MAAERVSLNPTNIKGIAHPIRVRLLGLLREDGPSTATRLAERVGQSSGVTSYHLRQLALHGFVEDDPDSGTGRERWWRARHRSSELDSTNARAAPAEAEAYLRAVAAAYADRVDRWIGELAGVPASWDESGTLSDHSLRLTAEEAAGLVRELAAVVARYRSEGGPPDEVPDGAERVVVQYQVLPFLGPRP